TEVANPTLAGYAADGRGKREWSLACTSLRGFTDAWFPTGLALQAPARTPRPGTPSGAQHLRARGPLADWPARRPLAAPPHGPDRRGRPPRFRLLARQPPHRLPRRFRAAQDRPVRPAWRGRGRRRGSPDRRTARPRPGPAHRGRDLRG